MNLPSMPYFDFLFDKFKRGEERYVTAYGKHVHWGYWADPARAETTPHAFERAEDELSRLLLKEAGYRDGAVAADVGCGFGGTIALANQSYDGIRLTGLNIDERQLARAREWVRPRPGNEVSFVAGDACALPFADGSLDAMTAVECIFHFRSRLRFLKEAHRVLRPGARLAITDFVPSALSLPLLGLYAVLTHARVSRIYGDSNGNVTRLLYRVMARLAGFRRITVVDLTRQTLPTYDAIRALIHESDPGDQVLKRANRPIEVASRRGWLRYLMITFEK